MCPDCAAALRGWSTCLSAIRVVSAAGTLPPPSELSALLYDSAPLAALVAAYDHLYEAPLADHRAQRMRAKLRAVGNAAGLRVRAAMGPLATWGFHIPHSRVKVDGHVVCTRDSLWTPPPGLLKVHLFNTPFKAVEALVAEAARLPAADVAVALASARAANADFTRAFCGRRAQAAADGEGAKRQKRQAWSDASPTASAAEALASLRGCDDVTQEYSIEELEEVAAAPLPVAFGCALRSGSGGSGGSGGDVAQEYSIEELEEEAGAAHLPAALGCALLSPAAEAALVDELIALKQRVKSGCIHVEAWDVRALKLLNACMERAPAATSPQPDAAVTRVRLAVAQLRRAERLCCGRKLMSDTAWCEFQRGVMRPLLDAMLLVQKYLYGDPLIFLKDLWFLGLLSVSVWKEMQELIPDSRVC